ncbi:hypothetical protein [Marininema mesophilum]|nr:hypothetical protein [Marininema mesophilum]
MSAQTNNSRVGRAGIYLASYMKKRIQLDPLPPYFTTFNLDCSTHSSSV